MTAQILLVEDELHLALGIKENLEAEGYAVIHATDGAAALEAFRAGCHAMVILDVMLPKINGLDVCRAIRDGGDSTPILFLTAMGSEDDRVRGLDVGGDDYLLKPFALRELLSRVRAMLRRATWNGSSDDAHTTCQMGGVCVDFRRFEVKTLHDGHVESLSAKETAMLRLFATHPHEVVSREEILEAAWGHDVYPSTRTVDNFIVRLRRLIENDPAHPAHLETIRGMGYRYNPGKEV